MSPEMLYHSRLALQRAIDIAGGQGQLARKIGQRQQRLSYWLLSANKIPGDVAIKISVETGVPFTDLRPDLREEFTVLLDRKCAA